MVKNNLKEDNTKTENLNNEPKVWEIIFYTWPIWLYNFISLEKIWKIQDNTEVLPTNAFGTLEFQGGCAEKNKAA